MLTYKELCEFYKKHGCKVTVTAENFKENVTKNTVPYECSNGHHITNLTKNCFNARINQNRSPCSMCDIAAKKEKRVNKIKDAIEKAGCTYVILNDDRSLKYICKCGAECQSCDSNVLKPNFIGCATCANPFNDPKMQAKIQQTNIAKYGFPNPFQVQQFKDKSKETIRQKYNCDNVMQNGTIFSRQMSASYRKKEYTLPSGKIAMIMGYEDKCIELLLEDYDEDELVLDDENKAEIWYVSPTKDGRKSRYYPDICIPSKKIMIEVKCVFTLKRELEQNIAKFETTARSGYELHLYVFDKKKLLYREVYIVEGDEVARYAYIEGLVPYE